MANQRELKVYVSENLFQTITDEVAHCDCSISGFARTSMLKEIIRRKEERMRAKGRLVRIAKDEPLEGQLTIGDS